MVVENYLIIGGNGFLGRWIVNLLLRRLSSTSSAEITISVFDLYRNYYDSSVTYYKGDLSNYTEISKAIQTSQATTVIHTASPPHGLDAAIYWKVNVEGTKNVVQACQEHGVGKLVFTSSAGVVYDGKTDLVNVDESVEFPRKFHDSYHEAKAIAETIILKANRQKGLLTCTIRPSGIFGPGDKQLIPGMIKVMENGQTKFQIGDNFNLFDFTYVENVAYAHLLAADKLAEKASMVDGEAFIITNGTPIPFWDMPRSIWSRFDHYPPYYLKLSRVTGLALAYLAEWVCYFTGREAGFTRYRVKYACSQRYFNIKKAKKLLGYEPPVELEEGIRRTCEYFIQEMEDKKNKKIK
ncbi:hypothetical protein G9A89_021868 [Geosiphon pyriformis]|nr:hypothetical protein G9A89_021868 [Geosiphon pyriformis]